MKFNEYLQEEYGPNTKLKDEIDIDEYMQDMINMLENDYFSAFIDKLDKQEKSGFGKRIDVIRKSLIELADDINDASGVDS